MALSARRQAMTSELLSAEIAFHKDRTADNAARLLATAVDMYCRDEIDLATLELIKRVVQSYLRQRTQRPR